MHFFKSEASQDLRMFAKSLVACGLSSQPLLTRNAEIKDQIFIRPDLVAFQNCSIVRNHHVACCANPNNSWLNQFHGDFYIREISEVR